MTARLLSQAFVAATLVACAAPIDSEAQGQVLAVDEAAGFWNLRPGSGRSVCDLSLSSFATGGKLTVLVENCRAPEMAEARHWRPTAGGFELLKSDGAVLMAFRRTGVDAFQATSGGWRLERGAMR